MYSNYQSTHDQYQMNPNYISQEDERFFWAPFVVGGLAGTALGYGIANNNQINHQPYYPMYPVYPIYPNYASYNYYY